MISAMPSRGQGNSCAGRLGLCRWIYSGRCRCLSSWAPIVKKIMGGKKKKAAKPATGKEHRRCVPWLWSTETISQCGLEKQWTTETSVVPKLFLSSPFSTTIFWQHLSHLAARSRPWVKTCFSALCVKSYLLPRVKWTFFCYINQNRCPLTE